MISCRFVNRGPSSNKSGGAGGGGGADSDLSNVIIDHL